MGRGRRKLRNEEFDDLCVEKDDEFMEGEMDGSVTYRGVKSNRGNRGRAPLILNLALNATLRSTAHPAPLHPERSPVLIELVAGLVPDVV